MPIPTVDDLRVKLCYICREEETYNQPASPTRRWVHPCKCTLIAHESCLLDWIKTSETNPSKKSSDVLKCPQCGAKYELESQNPLILRIMQVADSTLSLIGRGVTIMSIGAVVASFGAGVYILSTAYGAFAMQQFLGEEMFQLILSDDPSKWPLHSWINLPLIPASLILSQTKMLKHSLPLGPLMFFWPGIPVNTSKPPIDFIPNMTQADITFSNITARALNPIFSSWPPSPLLFGMCTTIIGPYYSRYLGRFRRWLLNAEADGSDIQVNRPVVRRLMFEGWHMEMRVEGDIIDNVARPAPAINRDQGLNFNNDDNANDNRAENHLPVQPNERADGLEVVPELINIPEQADAAPLDEVVAEVIAEEPDQQAPPQPAAAAAAPPPVQAQEAQPRDPLTIRVTGADIGRVIGSALLLPSISNFFGGVLFHLSKHSTLLRRFLGIRELINHGPLQLQIKNNVEMSLPHQIFSGLAFALTSVGAGSPVWRSSDPVWWRNSLGYGFWIVSCDLISLWREWLAKREVDSRKLKNRPFDEVDPKELDLITPAKTD